MRTTLTLDDDVAAQLEAWRAKENLGLKEAVNTALRRGLTEVAKPPVKKKPFHTPTVDLGGCLLPNLDNISEVLEEADLEWARKKLDYNPAGKP